MKIIIDDKIPYIKGILEPFADISYLAGASVAAEHTADADAIITRTRTACDAKLLAASTVKFIATATIGFDHIDTNYCAQHNIKWTNCPGCNSGSVKQYLTSTLLSLAIKHTISLTGKTLGVIGVGNVGAKVAAAGKALGMNVILNDPPRSRREGDSLFSSLEYLLENSDFVTTHTPLNRSGEDMSFHLADDNFFLQMKREAFYINTSRGEVCDNQALKSALKDKSIAGAVLDVWENEPGIDLELLKLLDYATPHIAGYSKDGKANGTSMSVQALAKFFDLPLKEWTPQDVPPPHVPHVAIKPAQTIEEELFQAVSISYDIADDTIRFLNQPSEFEYQRGNYPLRREFENFTFDSHHAHHTETARTLSDLGFNPLNT